MSPHELDPAKVLRLVTALGGNVQARAPGRLRAATFGGDEGVMGLSEPVAAALDAAVATVKDTRLLSC